MGRSGAGKSCIVSPRLSVLIAKRLEHVGSTAVPGLAAKPILDLQMSVTAIEPRGRYVPALERLGYLFVPDPESPDLDFFAKPAERPRSHHLHVCEAGSEHEFRHLAVRDYLRGHADEAAKYAALKREAAKGAQQDRLAYIEAKEGYVRDLESTSRDSGPARQEFPETVDLGPSRSWLG